jgi:hypothetical protein
MFDVSEAKNANETVEFIDIIEKDEDIVSSVRDSRKFFEDIKNKK